ncbi:luciferin 4-monooxygenase-like isoform X2 [Galleria mellonella]|nr:luciferin 4-monooxygenase-like isoform X2 [Galleria mellonella]XP_052752003.1 luciferin 4-monooxygenase-like isoform X2 [Galleria mellonella]XP_052752004.1 luciferin 4-monooxygenase-like isoform X2 [Galleria mellonella]
MAKFSRRSNDAVQWFMNELTSRIVAETGIPSDRFHLGKIILQSFKDDPDFVMMIDGATGESITYGETLERSVRCAIAFKNMGLETGDVIILMAPSHVDLSIPFYAAFYLGIIIAAVDRTLGVTELRNCFNVDKPKVVFCQSEKAPDIQLALNDLEMDTKIITFDKGDYLCSFSEFLEEYGDETPTEDFKPNDFDPEEAIALLVATSGTTGLPKAAAVTHKNLIITNPHLWSRHFNFPTPTRLALVGSPLQWLTAIMQFITCPIVKITRLQTSLQLTPEHAYHLINTYRPTFTVLSPTFITTLIKPGNRDQCDFTCFEQIYLAGSAVPPELVDEINAISPETEVVNAYGMSELTSIGFNVDYPPPGSCGKPLGCFEYRLINVQNNEDVLEPNVLGELWVKGPGIFKEYYNNPEATAEVFAEDRWFKTGDTFYRDDNWNYFFVERIKLLLKYKSFQISPVEVEGVIRQHPGVLDVAVTGIPDPECGDLPVACVVPRPGYEVTAQDIKDLVQESLSDAKQLRGGVIFVTEIPMTASTKVHRRKLKEMALQVERE